MITSLIRIKNKTFWVQFAPVYHFSANLLPLCCFIVVPPAWLSFSSVIWKRRSDLTSPRRRSRPWAEHYGGTLASAEIRSNRKSLPYIMCRRLTPTRQIGSLLVLRWGVCRLFPDADCHIKARKVQNKNFFFYFGCQTVMGEFLIFFFSTNKKKPYFTRITWEQSCTEITIFFLQSPLETVRSFEEICIQSFRRFKESVNEWLHKKRHRSM